MSIEQHPLAPKTPEATPEEIAAASAHVQRSAEAPAEAKKPWYQRTGTKVAGAVLGISGIVGGGIALAGGGHEKSTPSRSEASTSASANPSETISTEPTEAQLQRQALKAQVPNEAVITPAYLEEGGDTIANIDEGELIDNLNIALDNITYMVETGDFSAIDKTFFTDDQGNYPGAGTDILVRGIKDQAEVNLANQKLNPNQPVSARAVANILSVKTADFMSFEVVANINERIYGNPLNENTPGTEFDSVTTTKFIISAKDVKMEDATGQETDTTQTDWLILSEENLGQVS
jgi:hypothetical protein